MILAIYCTYVLRLSITTLNFAKIISCQVSWIRKSDGYILYIGEIKFVDDERFELIHGEFKNVLYNH